ncbi:MAG: transcription-repair coupling factor [Clostridia bacterium]|nr:transcription-repair coupling factor [Clostridia bacterium]
MLKSLISSTGNLSKLLTCIDNHTPVSVFGVGFKEKILILNEFEEQKLIVAVSEDDAINLYETLIAEGQQACLLINSLEAEVSKFSSVTQTGVLTALQQIVYNDVEFVVVSPKALINKLPSVDYIKNLTKQLNVGQIIDLKELTKWLVLAGYKKTDVVSEQMEFSLKGDMLTIYPINLDNPVKVSIFDEEIEFIRQFDLSTQQIIAELDYVNLYSVNYLGSGKIAPEKIKFETREAEESYNSALSSVNIDLEQGIVPTWAQPYLAGYNHTIFEYFNDGIVAFDNPKLILNEIESVLKQSKAEIKEKIKGGLLTEKHKDFYFTQLELFDFKGVTAGLVAFQNINNANNIFKPHAVFNIPTTPQINYGYNKSTIYNDVARQIVMGNTVLIYAESRELANKMKDMFLPKNVSAVVISSASQINKNCVNLITKSSTLSCGFNDEKLVIIGLKQVKQKTKNSAISSDFGNFLPDVGDYVVHVNYGIGRCVGITSLTLNNAKKDYIEIEYKNNDKLFLPVENIDSISKYVGGENPKINKLGSTEFVRTKLRVKEGIRKLTFDLKKLYAERSKIKGIQFPEDDDIQVSFEKSCHFNLTPDQDKAVQDVKNDMQSTKPMDRLICGDVGYGKTEVALRSAFKAVMAGYQVLLMCPTTILSQQHYNTFSTRLKEFAVNCEVLNRFKTKKESAQILEDLEKGKVDILIGTHRLLSADVKTKKLGLLILDEEQRFGVEHKEKLKKLKTNIDVLTLSATPIPRTLHSALIGVKDASVIETPPFGRVPVITSVCEYSDSVVANAITRELNRDGQVLIIYNRVETIYEFKEAIRNLVPDVVIDVAHGQMDEKTLENAIFKLYNGETQVLISTTLIENGVDLPRANTLIVCNADMLGLSQLYQLKGRIGRSDKQAYAIFCYDKTRVLSPDAYKRLGAIVEYSGLGNGYKIAMRDLEIRGAGSLFGAEQSGHIESIGYSMYLTLLNEAMAEIKGEKIAKVSDVKIDCYFDANLPSYYVEASNNRMEVYTEIAKVSSLEDAKNLAKKLEFNFGEVPSEVINLMYIARIKNACGELNIKRISIGVHQTTFTFEEATDKLLKNFSAVLADNKFDAVLNLEKLPILTIKNDSNLFISLENIVQILKLMS